MDYTPRYPQPFTLGQAVHLDVPMISEEISRLQNSLVHLRSTQAQLREANDESPDPEFDKALQENEDVIGSQEERISILRMALAEKGVPVSCRPGLDVGDHERPPVSEVRATTTSNSSPQEQAVNQSSAMASLTTGSHDAVVGGDGGIDL